MRYLFLIAAMILPLTPLCAAKWIAFGTSVSGTSYEIDYDSVEVENTNSEIIVKAWFKEDHSQDSTVKHRESKTLFSFRCKAKEIALLYLVEYDTNGNVIKSTKTGVSYIPVIPDSIGETMMRTACIVAEMKKTE